MAHAAPSTAPARGRAAADASPRPEPPETIVGIDLSAASDAGRRTWIAQGEAKNGNLRLKELYPAVDLPGGAERRDETFDALRAFIGGASADAPQAGHGPAVATGPSSAPARAAIGIDLPFGLPEALVDEEDWEAFVLAFPKRYDSADAFRSACRERSPGRELKRATDVEAETPFSPYNLRVHRQTFHGIAHLLAPLVAQGNASVLPMQAPHNDRSWVLEVCPASTLKRAGLYNSYKGSTQAHRIARARILEALQSVGDLVLAGRAVVRQVTLDKNGDALDAVLAAVATHRAVRDPSTLVPDDGGSHRVEGWVYA